ncbi:regulator of G-protein signaling 18 [Pteropus alecto]|uniref:regulator of G-protein signaling 18 n=1 Tax=Pteropus alecto TaxID=9402 RepID=UPI0003F1222C|nr:regulator of G-protein signaling 18 [Pteropus alecto]XP_039739283.1 regulator of G-protein signaling 18 [Pteropus giganteus]
METSLIFFSQLNMCESKEKTFFRLMHGLAKEETSKGAKIRAKEKRNRLSLLLQKPEFHEETQTGRYGHLAKETRVSPEEAVIWGESFDKLLSHKAGLETFTRFLKTEFSEENIEFWIACEDFKKSKNPQQIIQKAKAIYEKFIQSDAPQEVNLDFHTKELIAKSMTQPTLQSFDAAQSRVYQLMEQDSYTRFLKSDIYLGLIEGRPQRPTNLRRRSRSFTYNEFQDVKSDVAIWL